MATQNRKFQKGPSTSSGLNPSTSSGLKECPSTGAVVSQSNYSRPNRKFQKGVSLYFVVITVMIMLSSVMVLSNILYIRTKMIKDAGDSVIAFYAADSGIEKSLYYKNIIKKADPDNGWADPSSGYYLGPSLYSVESDPNYGYKSFFSKAGNNLRTLISIGKFGKIKRGIIVKW
ncbi:hypothetical protein KBC01_03070 [Candidatus Parcubacteria bacterium]|nr:hypothetical protein [Candidatus Parcubacteria bacterium]